MNARIDISPDDLETVQEILVNHVPELEVRAFGSRVTWTARQYSDLDLVLMTADPLDISRLADLCETFSQSDLPFQVDIVDWASTSESFREIIKKECVVVQDKPEDKNNNWPIIKLDYCATLSGQTILPSNAIDLPYIGLEHIEKGQLHLTGHGKASSVSSVKTHFHYNDILFGKLRPYFRKIIMAPFEGICSTDIWVIRSKEHVDQLFLFYCLASQAFVNFATRSSEGTRMPRAKWDYVSQYEIQLPPLPEQRTIAHILGMLDDKIELNRQMNKTLEATVRALFKSWFIDFEPVRAKMEGWDTGFPHDIADLFPDRLVDSEMGEIPEGWEVKLLKDCMNLTMGQSPPGNTYNNHGDGLPFFQGRAEFGFRYPEKRRFCFAPTRVADPEDTLVSVRAPVGDINLAWERCCIGRSLAALRHKSGSNSFTYHSAWALRREFEQYEQTGTVFGAINKGQFEVLKVVEPDARVIEAFDTIAVNLDARIRSNVSESHALATLRDTLLPELLSGEVRL